MANAYTHAQTDGTVPATESVTPAPTRSDASNAPAPPPVPCVTRQHTTDTMDYVTPSVKKITTPKTATMPASSVSLHVTLAKTPPTPNVPSVTTDST
jgi:hypothetical protein